MRGRRGGPGGGCLQILSARVLVYVRLQVDERDDTFVAVGRARGGDGWLRICRRGLEKIVCSFPPQSCRRGREGATLDDREFSCAVSQWRTLGLGVIRARGCVFESRFAKGFF